MSVSALVWICKNRRTLQGEVPSKGVRLIGGLAAAAKSVRGRLSTHLPYDLGPKGNEKRAGDVALLRFEGAQPWSLF